MNAIKTLANASISILYRLLIGTLMALYLGILPADAQSPIEGGLAINRADAHMDNPHNAAFSADEITIEAWVRVDDLTGKQTIAAKVGTAQLFIDDAGRIHFEIAGHYLDKYWYYANLSGTPRKAHVHSTYKTRTYAFTTEPNVVQAGTWHHIVGVFSAATDSIRLHVDQRQFHKRAVFVTHNPRFGNLPVLFSHFDELLDSGTPLRIGQGIQGQIGAVRLWTVARSGDEIAAYRDEMLCGDEQGLAGVWRQDDADNRALPALALDEQAALAAK